MARDDSETPLEESWQRARLIPTTGIRGVKDREQRATSALLAVIGAVPDFGKAILARADAPAGRISTFVEPQFRDAADGVHIPDGVVVVERGKTVWRALVEVKTGHSELEAEQVNRYLDIARQHDFDAVLTISNQIVSSSEESPADVDRRRLRNVDLRHVSWSRILTAAIVQREHRGVSDPEQAWILGELIAYLDDEASGAAGFEDMGQSWVSVRDGARELKLHPSEDSVRDIVARWDQFVQFLCLGLRQELGRDVKPVVPRKSDPAERLSASAKTLAETGTLRATINVPDTAGPMTIEPDLRARLTTTSVRVAAPRDDSRPKTKVNWLVRQLRDAADDLLVSVRFANTKETVLSEPGRSPEGCHRSALADRSKASAARYDGLAGARHGPQERKKSRLLRPRDKTADARLLPGGRADAPGMDSQGAQATRGARTRTDGAGRTTSRTPAGSQSRGSGREPRRDRAPDRCRWGSPSP